VRGEILPLALAAAIQSGTAQSSDSRLREVAGEYVAGAIDISCTLKISRSGSYSFACGSDPVHTGTVAVGDGRRITVVVPTYGAQASSVPRAPRDPSTPSWPPSLEDPTPPLVGPEAMRLEPMTLVPLRWGQRRYLVRQGALAEFCDSIAQGTEPRSVPAGWEFLRAGDHRRKAGATRPTECAGNQR
jgi:hypothetical protein